MARLIKAKTAAEQAEALASLRKMIKPGDTVYPVLRHVSTSGMLRVIDLIIPVTVTQTDTLPADARGFKIGVQAYATPPERNAPRAFSTGTVTGFDADTVTIAYQATADGRGDAESVTWPRGQVKFYRKSTRPGVRSIGWLAAKAMGDTFDADRQGIKVGGCGMDMGFHLVYSLGRTLWPNGTKKPHGSRNGEPDRDGGYALKHSWL
ncbi:hypothetical protein D869_gp090 [Caulobacter phage CcrRogue]|uniref:Uncharacterized protein n=1 Tax=Caulobacter phage CcrRogue TaxID=2927986 RepID=K4JRZ4_9CAUD|nr:hypothetical protein D869_gp011 [Caulobacter phage CcrRogue]YP_006989371.1 hypothetical protein D869_gp090 [Caulobacter phage CcrRogue]AFU86493.1 hypothetical protein CcrRogue_gp011 [Caulobacter phage CcrRogue]AFU86824.1 hypothetical protein CcrRogue_gp342 [Caulobacter phage CcrRogue]